METTLVGLISGAALTLCVYDIAARLRYQKELDSLLAKMNKLHNENITAMQLISDQISRLEMQVGLKMKPKQ